jgi:hypothetical protein
MLTLAANVVERWLEPVASYGYTGSFDCIPRARHFAQDDKELRGVTMTSIMWRFSCARWSWRPDAAKAAP